MSEYYLKHKNDICGSLSVDESGAVVAYKNYNSCKSPFLGNCNLRLMKKWWNIRAVPASRKLIQAKLKEAGCSTTGLYLAKNLALSMTDSYWICPIDTELNYEDVKLSMLTSYNGGKIPYHYATSYDANASLGGQMEKYWDLNTSPPTLVKESYKYYGQQAINEVFATKIHQAQHAEIPFVKYTACKTEDNGFISKCAAFTNDSLELIPAYEVIEGSKPRNDLSLYENYIQICSKLGISETEIRNFMDYQTITDFIISNTDEHLLNFGILRNSDSLEYIGPAPIFDSGNSMFYSEPAIALSRAGLLERKITSFYETEEKLIKNVKNPSIVDLSILPDPKDVIDFFVRAGIPEDKALAISKNYSTKIDMTKDLQRGLSISLYHELQKEKDRSNNISEFSYVTTLYVMCGLPGSEKTEQAYSIAGDLEKNGFKPVEPSSLYSSEQALKDTEFFIDRTKLQSNISHDAKSRSLYLLISYDDSRKEFNYQKDDDFIFYVMDMRIKAALSKGITVIFDAMNLDRSTRLHYIELAGPVNKELYLMHGNDKSSSLQLSLRLYDHLPDISEGWNRIHECGERSS